MLMVDQRRVAWHNRAQFFGVAAQMMRRILVDHARAHQAEKRGGQQFGSSLVDGGRGLRRGPTSTCSRVNEALERLAGSTSSRRSIVELRFFGGLTIEEAAEAIRVARHGRARLEDGARVAEQRD